MNNYTIVKSINYRTDGVVFPDFDTARQCDMQKSVGMYDPDTNSLALLERDGCKLTHKLVSNITAGYRPSLIAIPRGDQMNYFFGTEQDENVPKQRPSIVRVSESEVLEAVNGRKQKVCYNGIEIGTYCVNSDTYDLPNELDNISFDVWDYSDIADSTEEEKQYLDVDDSGLNEKERVIFDSVAAGRKKQMALDNVMNSSSREEYVQETSTKQALASDDWLYNLYRNIR